jgi:hypothetical protein
MFGVVMGESQTFYASHFRRLDGLIEAAMSPSALFPQFLGRILRASWTNQSAWPANSISRASICSPCSTSVQTTSTFPFRSIRKLYAPPGWLCLRAVRCAAGQRRHQIPTDPGDLRRHLIESGFRITRLEEPKPAPELTDPDEKDQSRRPPSW